MLTGLCIVYIISSAKIDHIAGFYAQKLLLHGLIRIKCNVFFKLERFHLRIEHKLLRAIKNMKFRTHDRKYFFANYVFGMIISCIQFKNASPK
ncbi:hypothetical protein D3C76_1339050 [compost metagenome]